MKNNKNKKVGLGKKISKQSEKFSNSSNEFFQEIVKGMYGVSNLINNVIFSRKNTKIVSAIIAFIICFLTYFGNQSITIFNSTYETSINYDNAKVVAVYDKEAYVIEGLPDNVSFTVSGELSKVNNLKKEDVTIRANLENLIPGVHNVKLEAETGENINVLVHPSNINVTISKKVNRSFPLTYDFTNRGLLDPTVSLDNVEFDTQTVEVYSSEKKLNEVAFIKALIDVRSVTQSFNQDAKLVAYNTNGEVMNVEIKPASVNAKVSVSRPSKQVSIVVDTIGKLDQTNKVIEDFKLSQDQITIYGTPSVLEEINAVHVQLPLNQIKDQEEMVLPLIEPQQIKGMEVSTIKASFKLVDPTIKTFNQPKVFYKNAFDRFQYSIVEELPSIKAIGSDYYLQQLSNEDITLIVDVKDISGEGIYEIIPIVDSSFKFVNFELEKSNIKIEVKNN